MSMGSLAISLIALGCVFGAALLGMFLRPRLPDKYMASDSKDVVRLGMGLVVATAAMALGLLVGSAKTFYDTQNAEMAQLASHYVLLDRILANYGSEASDARAALRTELAYQLQGTGPMEHRSKAYLNIKAGTQMSVTVFAKIQALSPKDEVLLILETRVLESGVRVSPNPVAVVFAEYGTLSPIFAGYADLLADAALPEFWNIRPSQSAGSGRPFSVRDGCLRGYSSDS